VDFGGRREFAIKKRVKAQFRFDAFNFLNIPYLVFPANVSNMVLDPDGTVKNLGGYSTITSVDNLGRDFDARHLEVYLRLSF
jgi:hypothetical protein